LTQTKGFSILAIRPTGRSYICPGGNLLNLKGKIISESLKLFSSKGFLNTSISDVMEASGASKGGLYNHFRNKEELFSAVLSESRVIWREINLDGLDNIDSPVGKIVRILENYRDRYLVGSGRVPGGCIFVRVSVESSDLGDQWPHLTRDINEGFSRFKAMIRRLLDQAKTDGEIRDEISTDEVADMVFSSMMGASVLYGMDRSAGNLNRNITSVIDYVNSLTP
jgi:AcrR family transcriptional regulator